VPDSTQEAEPPLRAARASAARSRARGPSAGRAEGAELPREAHQSLSSKLEHVWFEGFKFICFCWSVELLTKRTY
jgi:hypothetical protein